MSVTKPIAAPLLARARRFGPVLLAGIVVGGALTLSPALLSGVSPFALSAPAKAATAIDPAGHPGSFADLVAAVKPAVVNISTTQTITNADYSGENMPQFPPGSPFGDFFRHFFQQQMGPQNGEKITSLGSGFIIDPSGYVVTNNHVIGNAQKITVILDGNQKYPAKLIGRDPKTDLALLKIDVHHPLPYVQWGDANKARVGDWVVAVGNPFGLGGSVTAGIISARGRDLNSGPFDDFLQVDAPINRGNSGGPLFNTDGQVIGINSAIISPNGGSVGLGFAIPSSLAEPVIAQLKAHGEVERGWLGVTIQPVTSDIANSLGLNSTHGAIVAQVAKDSPAAKAGVRQGDVIVDYNGKPIDELHDLPRLVADTAAGHTVPLKVWRDGHDVALEATIAKLKNPPKTASNEQSSSEQLAPVHSMGLALASLDHDQRQRYNIPDGQTGVLVVGVEEGSAAANEGLQPGDVIVKVDNKPVTQPAEVAQQITQEKKAGRKSVLLLLQRDGSSRFVALNVAG